MTRRRNFVHKQKRRPKAKSSSKADSAAAGSVPAKTTLIHEGRHARRRSHHCTTKGRYHSSPIAYTATGGGTFTPFPLAVYRPASLMAMLLVASLLPKNTFSLRWLILSGGGGSGSGLITEGQRMFTRSCVQNKQHGSRQSPSCLSMSLDTDTTCLPIDSDDEEYINEHNTISFAHFDRKIASALCNEATTSLERQISPFSASSSLHADAQEEDWSSTVLDSIPRGGGYDVVDDETYAGLVNLGNTCYLNAQLQCAYHVPYLRQLVLAAKDEVVEVEVEVEVEIEDEKKDDSVDADTKVDGVITDDDDTINDIDIDVEEKSSAQDPTDQTMIDNSEEQPTPKAKTIRRTEMKQEVHPISVALRSLQHTFSTLGRGASSGTTNILCRALGINPYVQQDGQEFWKLFIPEVDYDKLSQLYSGYFEDYVREILPETTEEDGEEVNISPRERVRTEPFLDLSIPVAEGNIGSVESSLREMFTEPDILRVSEGNGWRPEKGAEKVDAYKGSSLKREGLPSLLQLHMKRFKYDWETGETSKINDCVTFPLELHLSDIISDSTDEGDEDEDDTIYDLQSIVIHRGEYGSGHYYSYVRPNIRSDDWYRFDDQQVCRVDYSEVVADAYGGRYRRKRSRRVDGSNTPKRRKGLFQRFFTFGGSSSSGGAFGYGGRTSSAYMLQYARRSDIPTLYLEDNKNK